MTVYEITCVYSKYTNYHVNLIIQELFEDYLDSG